MNTVYLLYGYGYIGDFGSKETLLAIYKNSEAAMTAMSEWVKRPSEFYSFSVENWQVQ